MRVHYPRTPHLPWSPGASPDDVRVGDLSGLRGREVVVTEKLDGENTTIYRDGLHARSLDSAHHPSRTWVKALQGRIGAGIPEGWRVCGENLFARHSIAYEDLDGFFYGFSVWDADDRCLDWDRTVGFLRRLGVPAPPVLWRGVFDEKALRALRLDLGRQEGFVVRTVEGFAREEFGGRVAKWVRSGHVQTDTHWMFAQVVENRLGPGAALWAVRSGAEPDAEALLAAVGLDHAAPADSRLPVSDVCARLDVLGRTGDARLAGALATLLHDRGRGSLMSGLAGALGMPLARRVADLVGLYPAVQQPYPDEDRRNGLVRLSWAADLAVLHAVAAALAGPDPQAREQVEWSSLHAEEAGLLQDDPLSGLCRDLRSALADLTPDAADRCWAETRELFARRPIATVEEAVAATWRWRNGNRPHVIHLIGPSGSGKSTVAEKLPAAHRISLDAIRTERGSRSDQRANDEMLAEGLNRLDAALAAGGTTVWDATSLNRRQRSLVRERARRRDAFTTAAVLLVDEDELTRRNAVRQHPVPPPVLAAQLRRFVPPYPGEAHRTWYIGPGGDIEDCDGTLSTLPTSSTLFTLSGPGDPAFRDIPGD